MQRIVWNYCINPSVHLCVCVLTIVQINISELGNVLFCLILLSTFNGQANYFVTLTLTLKIEYIVSRLYFKMKALNIEIN